VITIEGNLAQAKELMSKKKKNKTTHVNMGNAAPSLCCHAEKGRFVCLYTLSSRRHGVCAFQL
jgi:hypothetical protein